MGRQDETGIVYYFVYELLGYTKSLSVMIRGNSDSRYFHHNESSTDWDDPVSQSKEGQPMCTET